MNMKRNGSNGRQWFCLSVVLASLAMACLFACTGKNPKEPENTDPTQPVGTPTEKPAEAPTEVPGTSVETADLETETDAESATEPETDTEIVIAERGGETAFRLVCAKTESENIAGAEKVIVEALKSRLGVTMEQVMDSTPQSTYEIVVGTCPRKDTGKVTRSLARDEYVIRCVQDGEHVTIQIAYKGKYAMLCALDRFIQTFIGEERAAVPSDLEIRGHCAEEDVVITSSIPCLRDPCILQTEDGTYYAYGTGWQYYRNTSGSLVGDWEGPFSCVKRPAEADGDLWAPEVHVYRGAYYMFTTYHSSVTGRRGTTILRADSPEGPFVEITDGQITPRDWDAIDGTLYVDKDGHPWLIFVHEWVSAPEKVGRMAAARLSDDLTHLIEEPVDIFRADDPKWAKNGVTDGCWMYTTADGRLLMIWSNWDKHGYCVGIAESSDGTPLGTWTQSDRRLFSKTTYGVYDGGHGMLFVDADGQMYLSIHSPNNANAGRRETPIFFPVREDHGMLVPDIWTCP